MFKRTLDDFFATSASPAKKVQRTVIDLDPLPVKAVSANVISGQPDGLSILQSFVSEKEETEILHFLDTQKWRTDLQRRCMHYGGTYCCMPPRTATPAERAAIEKTIYKADDIPQELSFIVDRMIQQGLYTSDRRPAYCIVNEYRPGQGISAHVENFRFGEPVCSLTLSQADVMRFHELQEAHDGSVRSRKAASAPRTGRKADVVLNRRSLAVLRGDARSLWQHEIVRGKTKTKPDGWRRVSLTFRVDR